jgi:hypothetical protein
MSHAPERTVEAPDLCDFGTRVPVLLVYDDDGTPIDAIYGADIHPYLDWLSKHEPDDERAERNATGEEGRVGAEVRE